MSKNNFMDLSGVHLTTSEFLRDTYDKEEIFFDHAEIGIFNTSVYDIEEIKSTVIGRCFMVCSILPLRKDSWVVLPLRKQHKYKSKTITIYYICSYKHFINLKLERGLNVPSLKKRLV